MSYLLRFPDFKAKAVTFSYDDGSTNDRRLVGIFNDHGLKATFNLNSGRIRRGDEWSVREDELTELYRGHEIAVHGAEHLVGTHVPPELYLNDILEDRKYFEALTGKVVKGMAYPCGGYNDDVVNMRATAVSSIREPPFRQAISPSATIGSVCPQPVTTTTRDFSSSPINSCRM